MWRVIEPTWVLKNRKSFRVAARARCLLIWLICSFFLLRQELFTSTSATRDLHPLFAFHSCNSSNSNTNHTCQCKWCTLLELTHVPWRPCFPTPPQHNTSWQLSVQPLPLPLPTFLPHCLCFSKGRHGSSRPVSWLHWRDKLAPTRLSSWRPYGTSAVDFQLASPWQVFWGNGIGGFQSEACLPTLWCCWQRALRRWRLWLQWMYSGTNAISLKLIF